MHLSKSTGIQEFLAYCGYPVNPTAYYMDINIPAKEDSSETARELLIAISESVPDTLLSTTPVHKDSPLCNGNTVTEEDKADKLRSELISISYVPSPDQIALPETGAMEV